MKTNPEAVHQPRLSPFAFPSEATLRFALLIISVIGATLFIYSVLYWEYLEIQGDLKYISNLVEICTPRELSLSLAELGKLPSEVTMAKDAFRKCNEPLEKYDLNTAWWALGGVGVLLSFASLLHKFFPTLMIWREGLVPLDKQVEMADIVVYLKHLCQEIGIRTPIFLQKPTSRAIGGRAFGSLGRYYVVLPTGLLTLFDRNRSTFRAVMLHELAHLRNKDVDKTYFSVAVSLAFVLVAVVPFTLSLLSNTSGELFFQASWRVTALLLLVYLSFAAVVRSREFYADVRASTYAGSQALIPLLETDPKPMSSKGQAIVISILERLPYFKRNHWHFAFQFHPNSSERRYILETTDPLFHFDFWAAFGAGMAVTVAYNSIRPVIFILLENILGHTDGWRESMALGFIFAPLVIGIIGSGVWRSTLVSLVRDKHFSNVGKLGVGIGLGLILGQFLSFNNIVPIQVFLRLAASNWKITVTSVAFNLIWSFLLLVSLYYFFKWIAMGASAWLCIAIACRSPRPFYIAGLIIAGIWLSLWFGTIFSFQYYSIFLYTFNIIEVLFVLILGFPLAVMMITVEPLALIALVSLWAFPLSALLWRNHQTNSVSLPTWIFLEQTPNQLSLKIQNHLQAYPALIAGLKGGLIYCGLLMFLCLGLIILLPESVRDTGNFKLFLSLSYIGIAALMQARIAMKIARQVRYFNSIHGLFAAFIAGCVMALSALVLNLLFDSTVDARFAWIVFSQIVNWGTLLSLLTMMVIGLPKCRISISNSSIGVEA